MESPTRHNRGVKIVFPRRGQRVSAIGNARERFDIFICGGSQHVPMLKALLRMLHPAGTVHLGSSFLEPADLWELAGLYDHLHTPMHSVDGYENFELFCIRDIHRLVTAPHFIKLDADTHLEPDWLDYVQESLAAHPDAVLFGPRKGDIDVQFRLAGPRVRRLLGREVDVVGAPKVIGGFYVAQTAFFREQQPFMDVVHELVSHREPDDRIVTAHSRSPHGVDEDSLRNLAVHANGAAHRLHVLDSRGRVRILRPPATPEQLLARPRPPALPAVPRWNPLGHHHRPVALQE